MELFLLQVKAIVIRIGNPVRKIQKNIVEENGIEYDFEQILTLKF